jgi:hypothetical protein
MDITLNKTQLNKINSKLNFIASDNLIEKVIFKVANRIETQAKTNISRLIFKQSTGKLLQSVSIQKINKLSTKVLVGAKYGLYVNRGTGIFIGRKPWLTSFGGVLENPVWIKGMKPRPYWTDAIKKVNKEKNLIIKKEIEKYVNQK